MGKNEEAMFCLSWWSWRPLLLMMEFANQNWKLGIEGKTFEAMGYNDGAGIGSEGICQQMANALAQILHEIKTERFYMDKDRLLTEEDLPADPKARPDHAVCREDVEAWISFLRECGGFEVW